MFFTDRKVSTLRTAVASGEIAMAAKTLERVKQKTTPKGDVLELARVAAVFAAKKTPELIPYCHPIPIDGVVVEFETLPHGIRALVTVKAVAKTGVEMEALVALQIALSTIYDMLKPIDKEMEISAIRLLRKKGGKSDFGEVLPKGFKAAVVVTSDGTFAGTREDKSGKLIEDRLRSHGVEDLAYIVLPDDKGRIKAELFRLCDAGVSLILTTGGTGLGPRDLTVEATAEVIEREIPGISEAMRGHGQARTPYAMLSRGLSGERKGTIIVNLPGSSKGTEESLDALLPALFHVYKMMAGGGH